MNAVKASKKMELSEEIPWSVVIIIVIGTFMAILDSSIVNVALPKMMAVFGANTDTIAWVVTAYMLTLGVVMPLSGFLGDTFGYKRCYFTALALFVTGSFLCGFAWSMDSLIAARVIQAIGGGIVTPLGMAILYKTCPRARIGEVLGVWGISAMAAPAIGPTLGGYIVQYLDWRMIFYLNVPIGLINLFLVYTYLGESDLIKGKHFDLAGTILSSIGFFCLLLATSEASTDGWGSPFIVGLFVVAAISLTAFIINELDHPEPILQLSLFKNMVFTIANVLASVLAIGMFGVIFLMPIMIQDVLGQTALKCGLIMFPGAIASGLIMPFSGWFFDRYGARGIVIAGTAIITVTTFMMHTFNDLTPFSYMTMLMMVRGLGMGLCMMPTTNAGMNAAPPHLVGRASATINQVRQVSASFGIAILSTIMQNRQVFHATHLAEAVNMSTSTTGMAMQGRLIGLAYQLGQPAGMSRALGLGLIFIRMEYLSMLQAIDDVFIVAAGLCALGFMLSFFLMDVRKRQPAHNEATGSTGQEGIALEG
jgi:DHA2 family multidrug resistance protein